MVKMHDIRRSAADVKADKKALGESRKGTKNDAPDVYVPPEDEGARMEFEHHHLEKMGVGGALKHGDRVQFRGHGTVEEATSAGKDRATIRFHHGNMDHEAAAGERDAGERKSIRGDLEKAASKA